MTKPQSFVTKPLAPPAHTYTPQITEVTWSFSRTTGALYSWTAAQSFVSNTPIYHTIDMNMRRLIRRGNWRGFVSCARAVWSDQDLASVVDGEDALKKRRSSRSSSRRELQRQYHGESVVGGRPGHRKYGED